MNTKTLFGIFSITLALSTQVKAQCCITDGLVAYYPFNGNGLDLAEGNNMYLITIPQGLTTLSSDTNFINQGTFGPDRFGNAGNALSFDGTNMFYARSQNIIASYINNLRVVLESGTFMRLFPGRCTPHSHSGPS
jgi:hypothetical protein